MAVTRTFEVTLKNKVTRRIKGETYALALKASKLSSSVIDSWKDVTIAKACDDVMKDLNETSPEVCALLKNQLKKPGDKRVFDAKYINKLKDPKGFDITEDPNGNIHRK
jgi:hypothetical protein